MAGTVTIGGTVTTITTTPTDEGGATHFDDISSTEYNAKDGVQDDSEGYQEITALLGELIENYSLPSGNAAIDWLIKKLNSMRQQPLDGADRVYEQ